LDETSEFCPAFREEIEAEKRFLERETGPIGKAEVKEVLFELTPYVNVVKEKDGRAIFVCSKCGFAYCDCTDNCKLYCLVYERDPKEIHPERLGPDRDWTVYREFYCPGCGTQVEVEVTPPGTPILNNYDNLVIELQA